MLPQRLLIELSRNMWKRPAAKKRAVQPIAAFSGSFESAVLLFASEFLRSASFKHAVTKGGERERPIRDLLRQHLPSCFAVTTGEVVDLQDQHSPQLDVMIYDSSRNFAFYSGGSSLLPAESLLVSIEVKSGLTRDEIRKSLNAAYKLKRLRPFHQETAAPRKEGERADGRVRFFHTIFAYQTDLAVENWLSMEFKRYCEEAHNLNVPTWLIDRIYVPNRGMIVPAFEKGVGEEGDSGQAFFHFYIHILNFLLRENGRRDSAPYLAYAGRMTKGWTKLE